MKTILMKSPDATDGVSIYRQWGPMRDLENQGHCVLRNMPDEPKHVTNWTLYRGADLLMISRPASAHDLYVAIEAKKHHLPIWVDIDDNLFVIPDDNPSFGYFNEDAKKNASQVLQMADVITCATVHLKQFIKDNLKRDAIIVPNAQQEVHFKHRRQFQRTKNILWRGSPSHQADMLYYQNELVKLVEKYMDHEWTFMGMNPFFVSRYIKNAPVQWAKSINFIDFMPQINKLSPTFNFHTMVDCEFSRTRSNNGWQETTLAGAVTIAPDWPEWRRKGIHNYKDETDFKDRFCELLEMSDHDLKHLHAQSLQYVSDNLLPKINLKRLEIINNL